MTRSLITGGFGFIGRHLALLLADRGHEVTLFDIAQDAALLEKGNGRIKAIRGSLANWADVMDAVVAVRPDTIFHSGAILPPASESAPQAAFQVNIVGTYNILEACRLCGVARIVYASTMTSFGPDSPPLVPDDWAQHPLSMYGASKVCNERLGEYYNRRYDLDFRGVRFPAIFGPGRAAGAGWTAYTSIAIEEAARGRPFTIRAEPQTTTAILYVKDAARSMLDISSAAPSTLSRRVYNLNGYLVTAAGLADGIRRAIAGADISFDPDPVIVNGIRTMPRELDDRLARTDWGWSPRYSLDEAIADFVQCVRMAG